MNVKDLFRLDGKVALVTGGNKGLGRIISQGLAEAGAHVVIAARKKELCDQAATELRALGVQSLGIQCDITKPDQVTAMVDEAVGTFGHIDILVNNAGMFWAGSPETLPLDKWQRVMDLNITAMFLVSQAVGRVMIAQKSGRIINVASAAGLMGIDSDLMDTIVYNTSKGAVVNFTRDLACKWARHNINVVALAPGWFASDLTQGLMEKQGNKLFSIIPMKRFGRPDELKGAAVFLASDAAAYMTGHIMAVDGGILAT
ncbi:MAG: SDR family oxidoreductase [Oscillospiraceae bacterium]